MSEKKTNKSLLSFIKKNLYYLIIGISLITIAVVIAVVFVTNKNPSEANKPTGSTPIESEQVDNSQESNKDDGESSGSTDKEPENDSGESGGSDDKPTSGKIVFSMPIADSSVIKGYTSSTVVFNKTLGVYTGHMGIDFAAEAGTEVVAVYDGTIESITINYLQGTTVTINHGNGLKTVYNSIEALETLEEGKAVKKGDVVGMVSDNNRQEYRDGAHLHFEVIENGKKIDPETYLLSSQK